MSVLMENTTTTTLMGYVEMRNKMVKNHQRVDTEEPSVLILNVKINRKEILHSGSQD
jgi:hypothetical protein